MVSDVSSLAYLNSAGPPPRTGYKRFGCAKLCSAPDVRYDSIQRLVTPKHIFGDPEWRRNGRKAVDGFYFHASINMFSLDKRILGMHDVNR